MNLLGYILKAVIERNLQTEHGRRVFSRLRGTYLVGASAMQVTLVFHDNGLEIHSGKTSTPDAWVWGRLDALLGVALQKGLLKPIIKRQLRAGGKVWRLIKLIGLLRTEVKT